MDIVKSNSSKKHIYEQITSQIKDNYKCSSSCNYKSILGKFKE